MTVNIGGKVQGDYTKVDRTDSQGRYYYNWDGSGYGLAHLQGSVLQTDRGVANAFFAEVNEVTDFDGRPVDRNDPRCSHETEYGGETFRKTRHGYPRVFLPRPGGFAFSNPYEGWRPKCGSLASDTYADIQEGNGNWPPGFFFGTKIKGLSASKLARGDSVTVTCYQHSSPPTESGPTRRSRGFWALSINIVHFSADDLKRQQRRLARFVGKLHVFSNVDRPMDVFQDNFFEFPGKPVPRNGCRTG